LFNQYILTRLFKVEGVHCDLARLEVCTRRLEPCPAKSVLS